MQHTETITAAQCKLITLLAEGATIRDAVKRCQLNRSSYYRWMKEDIFRAELQRARRERVEDIRSQVANLTPLAVSRLHEILKSKKTPVSVTLRAALAVLFGVDGLADIDRKLNTEAIVTESTSTSAGELLASRIAGLVERNRAQTITIDVNGIPS